uniref:HDC17696 n=1 Tax=Drosophila melanogaster TaxID=7227 RepID=Q6IIL4_DROME|nr:TPA_inf: HDC17696 [Drosophila melanogaster]
MLHIFHAFDSRMKSQELAAGARKAEKTFQKFKSVGFDKRAELDGLDPEQKAKENQGEIPHWMLDAGCWMLDSGYWIQEWSLGMRRSRGEVKMRMRSGGQPCV